MGKSDKKQYTVDSSSDDEPFVNPNKKKEKRAASASPKKTSKKRNDSPLTSEDEGTSAMLDESPKKSKSPAKKADKSPVKSEKKRESEKKKESPKKADKSPKKTISKKDVESDLSSSEDESLSKKTKKESKAKSEKESEKKKKESKAKKEKESEKKKKSKKAKESDSEEESKSSKNDARMEAIIRKKIEKFREEANASEWNLPEEVEPAEAKKRFKWIWAEIGETGFVHKPTNKNLSSERFLMVGVDKSMKPHYFYKGRPSKDYNSPTECIKDIAEDLSEEIKQVKGWEASQGYVEQEEKWVTSNIIIPSPYRNRKKAASKKSSKETEEKESGKKRSREEPKEKKSKKSRTAKLAKAIDEHYPSSDVVEAMEESMIRFSFIKATLNAPIADVKDMVKKYKKIASKPPSAEEENAMITSDSLEPTADTAPEADAKEKTQDNAMLDDDEEEAPEPVKASEKDASVHTTPENEEDNQLIDDSDML